MALASCKSFQRTKTQHARNGQKNQTKRGKERYGRTHIKKTEKYGSAYMYKPILVGTGQS